MPDLHTTVVVTLGGLVLSEEAGYTVVGDTLGHPSRRWRIAYIESPWVHGSYPVAATLAHSSLSLQVKVHGSSVDEIRTRMEALQDAVSVFAYEVSVDMEGTSEVWAADPANYALNGETWTDDDLGNLYQRVNLVIPVHPVRVSSGS
jgi:hypothetical protein